MVGTIVPAGIAHPEIWWIYALAVALGLWLVRASRPLLSALVATPLGVLASAWYPSSVHHFWPGMDASTVVEALFFWTIGPLMVVVASLIAGALPGRPPAAERPGVALARRLTSGAIVGLAVGGSLPFALLSLGRSDEDFESGPEVIGIIGFPVLAGVLIGATVGVIRHRLSQPVPPPRERWPGPLRCLLQSLVGAASQSSGSSEPSWAVLLLFGCLTDTPDTESARVRENTSRPGNARCVVPG